MKKLLIITCLLASIGGYAARTLHTSNVATQPNRQLATRAGNCVAGNARAQLDINNVRTEMQNTGDIWWDRGASVARYGVPKLSQADLQTGKRQVNALFAGAIWVSGLRDGNLAMAAIRFSTSSNIQFWPGPIQKNQATIESRVCNKFDKFWTVTSKEIVDHINGVATSDAIRNWPGRGNSNIIGPGLEFSAAEFGDEKMAPFYDKNANEIYEPADGEYPTIKYTTILNEANYANQMIFWVLNDVGNNHIGPDALPIGLQVNCLAFAFASSDELNNMTFYTYEVFNESTSALNQTYMSQFVDCDMGTYQDDYIGCDTSRDLGYCINADDFDENTTVPGYEANVPIIGADFFEGPDNPDGSEIGMSSFSYFINIGGSPLSDPSTDVEHRNIQTGRARNGQRFTLGGNCITGTVPTQYCFPGNPNTPGEWSMCDANLPKQDVRFVQNSGPFEMESGSSEVITVGMIFVQPPVGSYVGCKVDVIKWLGTASDKAQKLFDNKFKASPGPDAPDLKIIEEKNKLFLTIDNPVGSNNYREGYAKTDIGITRGSLDSLFKFEGYLIYQVLKPSDATSFEQLRNNPKNAALIRAMDLKNNIVYPKQFVDYGPVRVAIDSLPFKNSGIERNLEITKDAFAQQGQSDLVNNTTYYFAVVAIAYNNFKSGSVEQSRQYKASDQVKIFSATPHDNNFYGLNAKTRYFQNLPLTRVSGKGHGSYFIDIIKAHEDDIILGSNGFRDSLTYEGGRSPFSLVVNNPYKLRDANFKLNIIDSSPTPTSIFNTKKSYYDLSITENGTTKVISSEFNLDRENELSVFAEISGKLEPYGVSISHNVVTPIGRVPRDTDNIFSVIGSSLTYQDSTKKWLTLLSDIDNQEYRDWIRAGMERNTASSNTEQFASNYVLSGSGANALRIYTDSFERFGSILNRSIAPYCLADNRYTTSASVTDANYAGFAPGFKWDNIASDLQAVLLSHQGPENNLDSLFSVNIVITSDPNKWSQCIVLETGDIVTYNIGGALKGQIRQSPSLDKDLKTESPTEKGRSWFPGYAINVETGERMNIYFGENSHRPGRKMIWDPNEVITSVLGDPVLGGSHFVYVTNTPYDGGDKDHQFLTANFNVTTGSANNLRLSPIYRNFYKSLIWTFVPMTDSAERMTDGNDNYKVPNNEISIKVRIQRPFELYKDNGTGQSEYIFSTAGLQPTTSFRARLDSSFNSMRIVPNPYNAYSAYEGDLTAANFVKFIGVPKNSTISIFTIDGTLVRKIKLAEEGVDNYFGANTNQLNIDNSYTWDMRTAGGILIASGVYTVHVSSPTMGEKVMKLFATMRALDVSNF
jgi:hypothetical protein